MNKITWADLKEAHQNVLVKLCNAKGGRLFGTFAEAIAAQELVMNGLATHVIGDGYFASLDGRKVYSEHLRNQEQS